MCACGFRTGGTDATSVPSVLKSAVEKHKKTPKHREWVQNQASQAQSQPPAPSAPQPQSQVQARHAPALCPPLIARFGWNLGSGRVGSGEVAISGRVGSGRVG